MSEDVLVCAECGRPDGSDWCDSCDARGTAWPVDDVADSAKPIPRSEFLRRRMAGDLEELAEIKGVKLTDAERLARLPSGIGLHEWCFSTDSPFEHGDLWFHYTRGRVWWMVGTMSSTKWFRIAHDRLTAAEAIAEVIASHNKQDDETKGTP